MREETKVHLKVAEGGRHCDSHKGLVDVLLSFDKRLGRLEMMSVVMVVAALSVAGKLAVWPVIQKLAGLP